ncbi:hypothetical protein [Roseivivax sp. CAU 1761]
MMMVRASHTIFFQLFLVATVLSALVACVPGKVSAQEAASETDAPLSVYDSIMTLPDGTSYDQIIENQKSFTAYFVTANLEEIVGNDYDALTAIDLLPRDEILSLIAAELPAPDEGRRLLLQRTEAFGPVLTAGSLLDPFQARNLAEAVRQRLSETSGGLSSEISVQFFCQVHLRGYDFQAEGFPLDANILDNCVRDIAGSSRTMFPTEFIPDIAQSPVFIPAGEAEAQKLAAEQGSEWPFLVFDAVAQSAIVLDQQGRSTIRVAINGGPPYRLHSQIDPIQELYRLPQEDGPVFDVYRAADLAALVSSVVPVDPMTAEPEALFGASSNGTLHLRWNMQVAEDDEEEVHPVPYLGPSTEAIGAALQVPGSHLVGGSLVLPDQTISEMWLVLPAPFDAWRAPRPATGAARNADNLLVSFEIGKAWIFGPETARTLVIAVRPIAASVVDDGSNIPLAALQLSDVAPVVTDIFARPKVDAPVVAEGSFPADMLGVTLGTDMVEAAERLRAHMQVGWTATLPPRSTPLPLQDFTVLVAARGLEQIALIPDKADPARLAGISRILMTEPGVTAEVLANSLREKYGMPKFESDWGLVWTEHPGAREDSPEITQAGDYGARCYADIYPTYDLMSLKTQEEIPGLDPFIQTQTPQIHVGGFLGDNSAIKRMATPGFFDTCGPTLIVKLEPLEDQALMLAALIDLKAYAGGAGVAPQTSAPKSPDL